MRLRSGACREASRRGRGVAAVAGATAVLAAAGLAASPAPVKLTPGDALAYDFAQFVALSDDTAVAGTPGDRHAGVASGAAYVYSRSGSAWTQSGKLVSPNAAAGDYFGRAVAAWGDWIAVGAPQDDQDGTAHGSVYLFRRAGSVWEFAQRLDGDELSGDFGYSLAIDTGVLVVGSPNDKVSAGSVFDGPGSVHVFALAGDGASWNRLTKLMPQDRSEHISFGTSVDVSGSAILVGASIDDTTSAEAGSAYVFRRSGDLWPFEAKLLSSNPQNFAHFGSRVALSGDAAAVVEWAPSSQTVYLFARSESAWTVEDTLGGADIGKPDQWYFGVRVALEGTRLVVGSWGSSGETFVFDRGGSGSWTLTRTLTPPDLPAFGTSETTVAISNGRVLAGVGGPPHETRAFIFELKDDGGGGGGSNSPPKFVLPVLASANPVAAGKTVKFASLATDPDKRDKIAYEWHFGDGSTAAGGASASKTYAQPGVYDVIARATDASGASADSETLKLLVVDASVPYFDVAAASVKLNFAKAGKDKIKVSGQFPLADGTPLAGKTFLFEFGAISTPFTLDAKGATPKGAVTVRVRPPSGGVAKFTVTLTGSYADILAALGLTDATVKNVGAPTRVALTFDGVEYFEEYLLVYAAREGRTGTAE